MVPTENMGDTEADNLTSDKPSNTSGADGQVSTLDAITLGIVQWVTPITVTFGLLGNILTFLVMTRKKNRRISCCVYMAVLAITDSYTLISYMGFNACVIGPRTPICWDLTACRISGYLMGTTNVAGTMLLVALTIDRFMAVRFPLKARIYCTPRRARMFSAVVLVFCFIYNIPHIFFVGFYPGPTGPACLLLLQGGQVYSGINIAVVVVVPFLVVLVLNMMIIRVIQERSRPYVEEDDEVVSQTSSQDRRKSSGAALRTHAGGRPGSCGDILEEATRKKERDKQLTRMLLFVTFAYVVLTAPQYTRQTLQLVINFSTTPQSHSIFTLITTIFIRLYYVNFAINFYLYFFTGSKFRMDLFRMLCCVGDSRSPDMTDSQVPNNQVKNSPVTERPTSRHNISMASNINLAASTQNLRMEFVRQMSQNNGANAWQNFKSFFGVVKVMNARPGGPRVAGGAGGSGGCTPPREMVRAMSAANLSPRIEVDANPIDVLLECQRRRSRCLLDVPMRGGGHSVSMSRLTSHTITDVIKESVEGESIVTSHHVINIIRSTSQEISPKPADGATTGETSNPTNNPPATHSVEFTRSTSTSRAVRSGTLRSSTRSTETRIIKEELRSSEPDTTLPPSQLPDITAPELDDVFHTGSDFWTGFQPPPSFMLNFPSELPPGTSLGLSMDNLFPLQLRGESSLMAPAGETGLRRCVSARDVGAWRVPDLTPPTDAHL